jgi:hypothetical protein
MAYNPAPVVVASREAVSGIGYASLAASNGEFLSKNGFVFCFLVIGLWVCLRAFSRSEDLFDRVMFGGGSMMFALMLLLVARDVVLYMHWWPI